MYKTVQHCVPSGIVWFSDIRNRSKSKPNRSDFRQLLKSELFNNQTIINHPKSKRVQISVSARYCTIVNVRKPNVRFSDSAENRTIDCSVIRRSDFGIRTSSNTLYFSDFGAHSIEIPEYPKSEHAWSTNLTTEIRTKRTEFSAFLCSKQFGMNDCRLSKIRSFSHFGR